MVVLFLLIKHLLVFFEMILFFDEICKIRFESLNSFSRKHTKNRENKDQIQTKRYFNIKMVSFCLTCQVWQHVDKYFKNRQVKKRQWVWKNEVIVNPMNFSAIMNILVFKCNVICLSVTRVWYDTE